MVYVVGTLAQAPSEPGVYRGHSEGLTRKPIVDRAAGSVHQELAVCEEASDDPVDLLLESRQGAVNDPDPG